MAAGIKIYGDLKFIGYEQDRRSGKNGQYLRYLDGVAAWADVHETAANNLVTVNVVALNPTPVFKASI